MLQRVLDTNIDLESIGCVSVSATDFAMAVLVRL